MNRFILQQSPLDSHDLISPGAAGALYAHAFLFMHIVIVATATIKALIAVIVIILFYSFFHLEPRG